MHLSVSAGRVGGRKGLILNGSQIPFSDGILRSSGGIEKTNV